jgi:hypothetical protein
MKNIILSFLYYIALGIALFIVLYLYSDDYNFPWSTHDEGLKYLHFVLTEPFPLVISLFSTFGISDIRWSKVRLVRQLLILFVFLATTVYMMADGGYLGHTKLLIGYILALSICGITVLLPFVEMYLVKRHSRTNF